MFLPILLSLGLLGASATPQVKNKLEKCPSNEELFSQLNINNYAGSFENSFAFQPYKLENDNDIHTIPQNIVDSDLKWISEMTISYIKGDDNFKRNTLKSFNTMNTDIQAARKTIGNWFLDYNKTGNRPSLHDIAEALKILSTEEKPLTLEWFLQCADDILSHKDNAVKNLTNQIDTSIEEKQKLLYELIYRVTSKKVSNYEPCTEWKGISQPVDGKALYHPNGRRLMVFGKPNSDTAEQHYVDTNSTDSAHFFSN